MSKNIHLFSQLELRSLHLKNRIVVSPMCQYKAVEGHIQDWHIAHHSRFALGGMAAKSNFIGQHRMIMIASLAKAQGY